VDGLTKLDKLEFRSREQQQAENVRKMIVAMAGTSASCFIKLADRPPQHAHARAARAGPAAADRERDARHLRAARAPAGRTADQVGAGGPGVQGRCTPGPYREIANLVDRRRGERQEYVDGLLESASTRLREAGLRAEAAGRPKHLYSILREDGRRRQGLQRDLRSRRPQDPRRSVRDCYGALGAIHSLWKPVPGRFKDYIAMPKSNMYQSLHTTVVGPGGRPIEVQIRTFEMHRTAEFGIARALRVQGGARRQEGQGRRRLAWLGQMLEWLKDMADPREFMEGLKIDLYGTARSSCSRPRAT